VNGTAGRADDHVEHSWYWTDFYTYIRLKAGADAQKLQAALPAFAERHINSLPDNRANHDVSVLQMIAMRDIHLYSHYTEEAEPTGDGKSVTFFLFMIGFFILGIALDQLHQYVHFAFPGKGAGSRRTEITGRPAQGSYQPVPVGKFTDQPVCLAACGDHCPAADETFYSAYRQTGWKSVRHAINVCRSIRRALSRRHFYIRHLPGLRVIRISSGDCSHQEGLQKEITPLVMFLRP
jgi:hypothetical protein